MMPSSLPTLRLNANFTTLIFLVLLSVAGSGCSESKNETEGQGQPGTSVQEPAAPPPGTSALQGEEKVTQADTQSDSIRLQAQEQLTQANEAVDKAQQLLKRAPSGKGSTLAIAALRQDLNAAKTLLQSSQTHFENEQFTMARDEAREAKKKADLIAQQIEQAIETVNLPSS